MQLNLDSIKNQLLKYDKNKYFKRINYLYTLNNKINILI